VEILTKHSRGLLLFATLCTAGSCNLLLKRDKGVVFLNQSQRPTTYTTKFVMLHTLYICYTYTQSLMLTRPTVSRPRPRSHTSRTKSRLENGFEKT